MLTLPFRIAASIFIALFCASSLVRRAVAGVIVSALIVAAQHGALTPLLSGAAQSDAANDSALRLLLHIIGV